MNNTRSQVTYNNNQYGVEGYSGYLVTFFLYVCLIHFSEHLFQMFELYFLKLPRPDCLGLIGLLLPELMRSQWLHFGFAVFMLLGLYHFMKLFGKTAFILQCIHTFEHCLIMLIGTSIGQLWFPRIELHFYYNLIVLTPMMISYYKVRGKV